MAVAGPVGLGDSVDDELVFFPFLPWPQMVGAHVVDGDPDTLWLMPRSSTVDDF